MSPLIIFDCDGTLVDSEMLCNVALEMCLGRLAIIESAPSLLRKYRGLRLADIFDDIARRHKTQLPIDFESIYRNEVARLFEMDLRPTDGIMNALSQIHHAKCVASSGPVTKIEHALNLTGLISFFKGHIYSSYEIGSWKPDPGIYLHAASREARKTVDCIVVEDSVAGIVAARAAGMAVLYYNPWGVESYTSDPHVIEFDKMIDLPRLIPIAVACLCADGHAS